LREFHSYNISKYKVLLVGLKDCKRIRGSENSKLFVHQTIGHFFPKRNIYKPPLGQEKVIRGVGLPNFLIKNEGVALKLMLYCS
jgi:hypothetical protein